MKSRPVELCDTQSILLESYLLSGHSLKSLFCKAIIHPGV